MKSLLLAVLLVATGCTCEEFGTEVQSYCVRESSEWQYAYSTTDGRFHYVNVHVCLQYEPREVEVCRKWKGLWK